MIQGTTPTLIFNLPFSTDVIKSAEIAIQYTKNGKEMLIKKTLEECELGETSIWTMLTQEETLQFPSKAFVLVQLRVMTTTGTVLATSPYTVTVKKLLARDVIE